MNEKFLSRGKREDTEKWVEGYYVKLPKDQHGEQLHIIIGLDGQYNRIIPETAGRCVGLTDKNSKLMFEGDIVNHHTGYFGVVAFGGCCDLFHSLETHLGFYIKWDTESYYRQDIGFWKKFIEVIGNIHDNPQMLSRADMPVSNGVFQPVFKSATPENFDIMEA